MAVSALTQAPSFSLQKKFGFECGFALGGSLRSSADLAAKGNTIFTRSSSAAAANKLATAMASDNFDFSSNSSAYNAGQSFGSQFKTIMLDFENQYGNYNDSTNVDRVGNFIKGAVDAGAKVGEFLYGMLIWNDKHVWAGGAARLQYTSPTISGIGTKTVNSTR